MYHNFLHTSYPIQAPVIPQEPKPVVKKLVTKTSLAEMARLADSEALEVVVSEPLPQTQFVSHAQAVLSPSPGRKIRSVLQVLGLILPPETN